MLSYIIKAEPIYQVMGGMRSQSRSETMFQEHIGGIIMPGHCYILQFLTSSIGITEQAFVHFLLIQIIVE